MMRLWAKYAYGIMNEMTKGEGGMMDVERTERFYRELKQSDV